MAQVCDHCGKVLKGTEWGFSISKPLSYEHFYTCSEECFKNILHKQGIATYPEADSITANKIQRNEGRKSLYFSIVAVVISIVAFMFQIVALL